MTSIDNIVLESDTNQLSNGLMKPSRNVQLHVTLDSGESYSIANSNGQVSQYPEEKNLSMIPPQEQSFVTLASLVAYSFFTTGDSPFDELLVEVCK